MIFSHKNPKIESQFKLTLDERTFNWRSEKANNLIHILWNRSDQPIELVVDGIALEIPPAHILTTTFNQKVYATADVSGLAIFSFNRDYYCIRDHDSEVSCNGILFFGAQKQLVIQLDADTERKLSLLLEVLKDEFQQSDNVQGEMLLILLKRLIILCTRLAKKQSGLDQRPNEEVEIIRQYNLLVDQHYRELKTVKAYAELLYKSPKTLSNLFSKAGNRTPLQTIHDRLVLEARRLLLYTDMQATEIAYDLGFDEPATFFKLFKKAVGLSPQAFRQGQQAA